LVLNSDAHGPSDLVTIQWARNVAVGAGLTETDFERMQNNAESLL
jgi:putative hydrolase